MSLKVLMGRDGVAYLVSSSNIADGHPQGAIPALPIKLGSETKDND
jgi:catabolite regulation protein CreA